MNFSDVGQMVDELVQKTDCIEAPVTDAERVERKVHLLAAGVISELLAFCQAADRRIKDLETKQQPERWFDPKVPV